MVRSSPPSTEWLASTDWSDFVDPIVETLVPNFFIVYFGQDLTYGNIDDDEVMLQLARMGAWAETAKDAIDKFHDIVSILDKIDDDKHP